MRIKLSILFLVSITCLFSTEGKGLSPNGMDTHVDKKYGIRADPTINVLFIGNSLTYTNDLPGTLAGIAAMGNKTLVCASVAKPNFALIDHLDGGSNAVDVIRQGGWNYVILQQGPSSLPESRVILIDGTVRFNSEIRAVGAVTALYMVWPDKSRYAYFEAVRQNYKAAADTVGGLFLPAGESWLKAWEHDSSLALYGPDDFHPSPLGTYLAALVIYERITGADARELPALAIVAGDTLSVPEATIRLLQSAAHTTNARYATTGVSDSSNSPVLPPAFALHQNYPNPFNPTTMISFDLSTSALVTLKIYNILGQPVTTLLNDVRLKAGSQTVELNAVGYPSGIYFYTLEANPATSSRLAPSFTDVGKMLLIK